jgi:phage tail sheath protein FI
VGDVVHGVLNDADVNAIRPYPGRGVRVAGARTLSSQSEWRYVNVRRLVTMIEEAIDEETQWTVFEPNNPQLGLDLERVIRSFLERLWRRGMLDGATAAEAFYVKCDAATNPSAALEAGRLTCEVGLRPPWPAEVVVVRIGKSAAGVEIIEERGGRSG